jgi:hypothetical protein
MFWFFKKDDANFVAENLLTPLETQTFVPSSDAYLHKKDDNGQKLTLEVKHVATNAFSAFCKFLQSGFTRNYLNNTTFGRHLRDEFQRQIESVMKIKKEEGLKINKKLTPASQKKTASKMADPKNLSYQPDKMLELAKNYLNSKRRLSLHARLLNNMKEELDTRKISATTTVRNYITRLIMRTGGGKSARCSQQHAVNNMLVEEFQAGVHMEDKNCWIVSVHQHKTPTSAGVAEVPIMGDDLKRFIELYIEHAMPFFKTPTLRPGSDEVIVPAVEPTDLLFSSKTDKQTV